VFAAAQSVPALCAAQAQAQAQAPAQPQGPAQRASLVIIRSDGAQDCPEADTVAAQVRTVAGANVIGVGLSAAPIETWVQVAISRNFGGYTAQISTSGVRHGTRTLEDLGPTCKSLADAVAVTIAMFLDPYESPASKTPVPAAPAPPRLLEPRARPVSLPAESRLFVDSSVGIAFNLLAHTQPFLSAGFGWRPSAHWSVALGGMFVVPDLATDGTRGVDLQLSVASLQVCAQALGDTARASLSWCAAPQLGSLAGSGTGYQNNFSERALWLALAIGPEAAFRITRSFSWVLAGQGVIPLLNQGFDVQSNGVRSNAFQSPAVAGLVSLGVRGHL
jgi:hypothetical protein